MSSNTGNGDAGSDPNNVYPSLLSSNNFNPYTVSPYAPLTANQGGDNRNPEVDTIRAYSVSTIEVLANMNIATPNTFSINGQQILPNQIVSGITKAYVIGNSGIGTAEFVLQMNTTEILAISSVEATFQNENTGLPFTLNVKGQTNTQKLAVGTPPDPFPAGYIVNVDGNVLVDGNISSSGTFDISGLQVETLGVKTLLDVSGQSHLYGLVTAQNGINVTGNSYVLGRVGIQKTNPTEALDVVGNIRVSNNLDVSGNAQITGNTYIQGNLDVSGAINLEDVIIIDAKVTNVLTVLGRIDTSGLRINSPFTGLPSGTMVMEINGKSTFYNDMDITGGQLNVNATLAGNTYNTIKPTLLINESIPADNTARLEVNGFSNFLGSVYVENDIDASGTIRTVNEYVKNNLDVSGNLTVSGTTTFANAQFTNLYVQNKLDVSGQIDTSGLYVKNNLDVSGNLNVSGTTTFGNAQFANQYVQNKLDVSGQIDTSGLYVYNNLDVSGQIDTSGLYVYNNLDVSGNLNVSGTTTFGSAQFQNQYIQNKLDVSGQTDVSGLYVYNNLDVSGNLNVSGITTFGNAQFQTQYIQNKLDVSGQIDTSGLYIYNNLDVSGTLTVSGTTTFGNAQFQNLYVYNHLDVSGQIDTSGLYVYNNLDISGNLEASGNTVLYGTLDSRIPISTPTVSSASLTLPLNPYATIYVIDNGTYDPVTIDTISTPYYPNMVGTTSYFTATTASPSTGILLKYNGLGAGSPYTMTAPVPVPGLITMTCIGSDGSTINYFSTYPFA